MGMMTMGSLEKLSIRNMLRVAKAGARILERVVEREGVLDSHNLHYHDPQRPAINVKIYSDLRKLLTEEQDAWLGEDDSAIFEIMQEDWWETAKEQAKEMGIGKIYSAGRSGGWLVWNEYTMERLEDIYRELCDHIATMESSIKALETETDPEEISYLEEERDAAGYDAMMLVWYDVREVRNWIRYATIMKDSLKYLPESFKAEVEFRMEQEAD